MIKDKPKYKLGEDIYKSINKITNSSKEIITSLKEIQIKSKISIEKADKRKTKINNRND